MHPFDSCKYKNIINFLKEKGLITSDKIVDVENKPTQEQLLTVHTQEYLDSLKYSSNVAAITEIFFIAALPNFLVQKFVLDPFRYATSGTILASHLAMQRRWAINIGGGFHHCCGNQGGGFCAYGDITLTIQYARENYPTVKKVMIIDLDAHQGNGHARDVLNNSDEHVYIFDMYNPGIYPHDTYAKTGINCERLVRHGTGAEDYLYLLQDGLEQSFSEFTPDLIVYNAGTDILEGDTLGNLNVSAEGVMERDRMVFDSAIQRDIPIVMLLSGGYQKSNAQVISNSIANLHNNFNLLE
eukprot:TRINITY_DN11837_c0_g1_i1.p1 TRINITY_DN11837_c0_g1~~TRINITY_DN11837_c0_g1_i1.p1  ORF type:complete len:335 (-),score=68.34 TRINITY_DN11837_c0_g1_i1:19-912(-)